MDEETDNDDKAVEKDNSSGWYILWRTFLYFGVPVLIIVAFKWIFGW